MPFSIHEGVKSLDDLHIGNNICVFIEDMKVIADFDSAAQNFKTQFEKIKKSIRPISAYFSIGLISTLPFTMPTLTLDFLCNKISIVWTNVPGLKRRLTFAGAK